MSMSNAAPLILLDSDVIRHFISGGLLENLPAIYAGRFIILDKVKKEICRSSSIRPIVELFIQNHNIHVMPFPTDMNIIMEYAYLHREFGEGESACMAVAKHQNKFIASSNLKDIEKFCTKNCITYLTTMDILDQGLKDGHFNKGQCDQFIFDVLAKGSKLPFGTMDEYHKSKLSKSA
ncbi:hypothetical protein OQX61_20370 [Pedobacter sp. PLR]|uniref:hypothetical protein n=1 Tax=Pedobacter sp. PLR TaxID=2994465 RepID=UPI00224592C7|nr:hypothetical protein [Pedobacter sp. PLR]MCX2453638.1 hypothetical protein [Pedobacter sp. PLR]